MIRAGTFALALCMAVWGLGPAQVFGQFEGPGGIVYSGQPTEPPAYVAGPGEPSQIDPAALEQGFLHQRTIDDWFLRAEYLNWNFRDASDTLLGSPAAGVANPRLPTPVLDPISGAQVGVAIVPDTHLIQLRSNNGIRVTTGAELLTGGKFEINGFLLEKAEGSFTLFGGQSNRPDPSFNLIATSTFVNDQLAANYETYNLTFSAVYQSRLWGAGADYFFDVDRTGLFQFMPTAGFRYVSVGESLVQTGIFRDDLFGNNTFVDEVTTIGSKTWNNVAGPQIGFRLELVSSWVTLGVDPRIGLGANGQKSSVYVNNFQGGGDPFRETHTYDTHASFWGEVNAYTALHLSPCLTIRAGYNFLWLNQITRPEDNIYYNEQVDAIGNRTTDVRVRSETHIFSAEGLTLGAEFRW